MSTEENIKSRKCRDIFVEKILKILGSVLLSIVLLILLALLFYLYMLMVIYFVDTLIKPIPRNKTVTVGFWFVLSLFGLCLISSAMWDYLGFIITESKKEAQIEETDETVFYEAKV